MTFYEITAELPDVPENRKNNKNTNEDEGRRLRREASGKRISSHVFNETFDGKKAYFIANIEDDRKLTIGLITKEDIEEEDTTDYLKFLGYEKAKITGTREVVFETLESLLRTADRSGYIDDADDFAEAFGLSGMISHYRSIPFGEKLIPEKSKQDVYRTVREYLAEETIVPELDRIYMKTAGGPRKGHPVHYMLFTDSRDSRKVLYREVLTALAANGRLHNRRYLFFDLNPNKRNDLQAISNLYNGSVGGCVVCRISLETEDDNDDDIAPGSFDAIEKLCENVELFRNDVLSIICLPAECRKIKEMLLQSLGTVSIVELHEDKADAKRAKAFLKNLAARKQTEPDKALYQKVKKDGLYQAQELTAMYNEWYNMKLKEYYPQYKEIGTAVSRAKEKTRKGSAYMELMEMTGLEEAKAAINKALDFYKAQKLFKSMGMQEDRPSFHLAFTGNPGTAKTTVARLFAEIMKENGLLSNGTFLEVGRSQILERYVGWTAKNVTKLFERAKGGVLFIDEAYSLVDDRKGSFGDEAINTIVQEMENHRDDVIVIVAGYKDPMEEFLQRNEGLRSRIAFHIDFPDYNSEDLTQIAELMSRKKGFSLTVSAKKKLRGVFEEARKHVGFGNGRYVRNLLEVSRMKQAQRLLSMDVDTITKEDVCTLTEEDIELPVIDSAPNTAGNVIGFAC